MSFEPRWRQVGPRVWRFDDICAVYAVTSGSRALLVELECTINGEPVTRERAEQLARAAGLEVRKSVTKTLDILVVADPHTSSGKAKKARRYGTRIIAETSFWPLIGVTVD